MQRDAFRVRKIESEIRGGGRKGTLLPPDLCICQGIMEEEKWKQE